MRQPIRWAAWLVALLLLAVSLAGCNKIYHRQFASEQKPEGARHWDGYWTYDYFKISQIVYVGSRSDEPIVDTSYNVNMYVLPTDSSGTGNARFVQSFMLSAAAVVNGDSGDTLAIIAVYSVETVPWRTYNRKEFSFEKVLIPTTVERITITLEATYRDRFGETQTEPLEFKLIRNDGHVEVLPGWLAGP